MLWTAAALVVVVPGQVLPVTSTIFTMSHPVTGLVTVTLRQNGLHHWVSIITTFISAVHGALGSFWSHQGSTSI